jgi:5-methylcytosine-specific restriction endonuclease McrA
MPTKRRTPDAARLDRIVAEARRNRDARAHTYREQALKLFPWICGRCAREFDRSNVHQLTVHHKDHDHDNNPSDGSNWELLCVYCHDNEHSRELEAAAREESTVRDDTEGATHRPFANLADLIDKSRGRGG